MRSSRAEPPRRALGTALAGLALLALTGAAAAEVGAPVRLGPPAAASGGSVPPAGAGSSATATTPGSPKSKPGLSTTPVEDAIKGVVLPPVDTSWAGPLSRAEGAFPETMWRGTPRAFVGAALPQLAPTTSPGLQELARRLLLSTAAPPAGPDAPDHAGLAALRIERLVALGQVDGALAVLDTLPRTAQSEDLDRTRIELRFAANDIATACRETQERMTRYQGVWWERAMIACQALAGDHEKAELGIGLLAEQKAARDAVFDTLVEALGGRPVKLDKLPEPTPIRLALLAAAKLPLPADALAAAEPIALRAWATNEKLAPVQRLAAAERAVAIGALSPAALVALYQNVEIRSEDDAAVKHGRLPEGPRAHALLYLAARNAAEPAARAGALRSFLADARKHGGFATAARVAAPLLVELSPAKEFEALAPDAARALLIAGQPDAARGWIAVSERAGKDLELVMRLARPTSATVETAAALHDGLAALAGRDTAEAPRQAMLMLALLAAFDDTVSGADWAPFIAPARDGSLPGAALWLDQQQAAAGKRLGETVLATLLLAAAGDRLSPEPIVLNRAVSGLRAVGLEDEARALAVEAALAAGT
jgi:hypothetical protein